MDHLSSTHESESGNDDLSDDEIIFPGQLRRLNSKIFDSDVNSIQSIEEVFNQPNNDDGRIDSGPHIEGGQIDGKLYTKTI